ncbi:MAG: hypothetical protein DMD41_03275 [Gemmatimonadetes bacterium]|nr:MAG: hypothetical protein DMD41_03275 [Gemmatimonadota bacterium]
MERRVRILHVNDVGSVGDLLVRASCGRDVLYQPAVRHGFLRGRLSLPAFVWGRVADVSHLRYGLFAHLVELAGAEYSLHLHGGDLLLDLQRAGLRRLLTRRAIAGATRVAVATPDLLEPARRYRPDAVYIPNPMDLPAVSPRAPVRQQPHLVMLSKMDYLKGWEQQVRLMEALRRTLPDMTFGFFGHGQLPAELRARFTARLVELGGTLTPPLPRADFHSRLAAADFAVGQLEVGSLGMSELEALALGVPTVADARAHVAAGYAPVVVPPAPADAAVALRELWEAGPAARARWGEDARAYLRRVHAPERSLQALQDLLAGHNC